MRSLPRSAEPGLALLFQAREYARQLVEDPWEFAVEVQELKSIGMTVNDLRWLLVGHFVEHACDVTQSGELNRQFREVGRYRFSRRSCFVLTPSGVALASQILSGEPYRLSTVNGESIEQARLSPIWDPVRHELTYSGRLVKRFKQHSPNQEAVLTAFAEEGWPSGVLDPLSPLA
ncbi:MAG: hypothetical protein KF861_19680, partial [Planctomycetaceae bacterium]|nr:hypothetical protein [Planctomycetaceae bacterium]